MANQKCSIHHSKAQEKIALKMTASIIIAYTKTVLRMKNMNCIKERRMEPSILCADDYNLFEEKLCALSHLNAGMKEYAVNSNDVGSLLQQEASC